MTQNLDAQIIAAWTRYLNGSDPKVRFAAAAEYTRLTDLRDIRDAR